VKHEPTLVSPSAAGRERRIRFYRHAIDCAARLGADCVSIWSGPVRDDADRCRATERLLVGLREVLQYADQRDVTIGFEPEPGMLVNTLARFGELRARLDHPRLGLTLDVGHVHCQREGPPGELIRRWADRLVNVHLDDARRDRHEHLMLGEGQIDFAGVFTALHDVGYDGGVYIELSRHSHVAPKAARQAIEFCRPWCGQ
jgi:sugar phosphate isomerase/epimerase